MALMKFEKQVLLGKHAKSFAADKNETSTSFQGIRYEGDGTAYVTNTHILLRMKDVSQFSEPHTLHSITGAELKGTYPSRETMDNLFKWDPENQIILENIEQIDAVTRFAKIAQVIEKELKSAVRLVNIKLGKEMAYLETKNKGAEFSAPMGYLQKVQDETWAFNADYLYNAMNLFKSAKTESLIIKFKHKYSPITLSDEENGIDVLILPIRS